ncbi:DUF3999 family protein, partial [uncultured Fretibacterium sp.]|uniref:DUF3999 family protein n=1 Tax=uncultured Fretibacterium sp. TaxID=1678694 RepID=UPI00260FC0A3
MRSLARRFAAATLAACLAGPAWARPLSGNFAHVLEIAGAEEGALCRLRLPTGVYAGLARSQTEDLVVLDARGEPVSFAAEPGHPIPQGPPVLVETEVPCFELSPAGKGAGSPEFRVKAQREGRLIELQGTAPEARRGERRYLLDLSELSPAGPSDRYRLLLASDGMKPGARADVLMSVDLKRWREVVSDVPLEAGALELPRAPTRCLLLRVRGAGDGFALQGASCTYRVWGHAIEGGFADFSGVLTEDRRAAEYDTGGAWPVTRVQFLLSEPGRRRVRCLSRSDIRGPWQLVGTAELYLARGRLGAEQRNGPIPVHLREDRHWRVEFDSALMEEPPLLRAWWSAGTVLFRAQGPGPWSLAFGCDDPPPLEVFRKPAGELDGDALEVTLAIADSWGGEAFRAPPEPGAEAEGYTAPWRV